MGFNSAFKGLKTYNQIWELVMSWKRSFSTDGRFSDNRI